MAYYPFSCPKNEKVRGLIRRTRQPPLHVVKFFPAKFQNGFHEKCTDLDG